MGSIPGWGRSPREGNGYPFQYSWLENSMDRGRSLVGYNPWNLKSQTRLQQLTLLCVTPCILFSNLCILLGNRQLNSHTRQRLPTPYPFSLYNRLYYCKESQCAQLENYISQHPLQTGMTLLFCSVAKSCLSLRPHGLQHTRLPCPSLSPGVCFNSCLLCLVMLI